MPVYGGWAYDGNAYLPFAVCHIKWDANVTVFLPMTAFLIAGAALAAA
jgi:hypothetical protein